MFFLSHIFISFSAYTCIFYNYFVVTKVPEESIQNAEVIVDSPNICNNSQKIEEVSKFHIVSR